MRLASATLLSTLIFAAASSSVAAADEAECTSLLPDQLILQAGASRGARSRTVVLGATWHWHRRWEVLGGTLGGYWELAAGRWMARDPAGSEAAWFTQLAATPVLRWQAASQADWFVEAGIGANLIAPLYRGGGRRFSTAFNFGDHIAVGRRRPGLGLGEVALRLQHFSNAGVKRPNPGEDFVQLRLSWELR